jgi:hypothetical protein
LTEGRNGGILKEEGSCRHAVFSCQSLVAFLWSFLWAIIRGGVTSYCKVRGKSNSFLKKNKRGAANYLLYKQLHRELGLGIFYYLNYAYLICLGAFAVATLFSWISLLKTPITVLGIVLGIVAIPVFLISHAYDNLERFGRVLVLWEPYRMNGHRSVSTPLDWLFGLLPLPFYLFLLFNPV